MARSISGLKKFPGLSKHSDDGPQVTKFGFTRRSPRCAQCLKFKAEDPSKIGADEFEKLLRCSNCKKVNYCSKVCAEKNFPFHQLYCQDGNFGLKYAETSPPSMMYAPAVMGEDVKLCEEFLHFAANETNYLKPAMEIAGGNFAERDRIINEEKNINLQPSANADINVMLFRIGLYLFLKPMIFFSKIRLHSNITRKSSS